MNTQSPFWRTKMEMPMPSLLMNELFYEWLYPVLKGSPFLFQNCYVIFVATKMAIVIPHRPPIEDLIP